MSFRRVASVGADCVACGNCVRHCPFDAISVHTGLRAQVDDSKCKGCGKCVAACPADVIEYEKREVECA